MTYDRTCQSLCYDCYVCQSNIIHRTFHHMIRSYQRKTSCGEQEETPVVSTVYLFIMIHKVLYEIKWVISDFIILHICHKHPSKTIVMFCPSSSCALLYSCAMLCCLSLFFSLLFSSLLYFTPLLRLICAAACSVTRPGKLSRLVHSNPDVPKPRKVNCDRDISIQLCTILTAS